MTLSSGLPTRRLVGGMTRIIRTRARTVTIRRPETSQSSLDDTTTTTVEHTECMWLFEPRENISQELVGERLNGSLGGLLVADRAVDVRPQDRVTHGGVEYEVDTVVGHPSDEAADGSPSPDTDFFIVNFTRRQ